MAAPSVTFGPVRTVASTTLESAKNHLVRGLASDGTGWLVAYGVPNAPMFFRRIDAGGKPTGDPVIPFEGWAEGFRLAYDEVSYLAAWEHGPSQGREWHVARFGADGSPLGEIMPFGEPAGATSFDVAGGEQSALAIKCNASCLTRVITPNGVVEGDALPSATYVSATYSDGVWLVVLNTQGVITLTQLGADGTIIEGTTKTIDYGLFRSAVATPTGFALVWLQDDNAHLGTVDFDGTLTQSVKTVAAPASGWYSQHLATFGGKNYLFATADDAASTPLVQRLSASFEPVGDLSTQLPAVAAHAAASSTAFFGVELAGDDTIQGTTVHYGDTITADALQLVSVAPVTRDHLVGAAAADGWLVLWREGRTAGWAKTKVRAARLHADGTPASAPFDLEESSDQRWPSHVSRGPGGWFVVLEKGSYEGSNTSLEFLADDASDLSPIVQGTPAVSTRALVGSAAGWGRLFTTSDAGKTALHLERFNEDRLLLGDAVVLQDSVIGQWPRLALQHGKYLVTAWKSDGKAVSIALPTSGDAGALAPRELFDVATADLLTVVSDFGTWGISADAVPTDILAFPGAALEVNARTRSPGAPSPGGALLAGPTSGFVAVPNAPSLYDAHFSEQSDHRALLLGYERPYFEDSPQSALLSVVDVTGEEQEAGGAGGAGAGGQANGVGGSELLAGAPGVGGTETVPSDGGAATTPLPTNGGTSSSNAGTANGGRGGKPPLGNDTGEGGRLDEGDDVTLPSNPSGSHNSQGCGCRAAGTDVSGNGTSALPLLLLGALAVRRRRIIPS